MMTERDWAWAALWAVDSRRIIMEAVWAGVSPAMRWLFLGWLHIGTGPRYGLGHSEYPFVADMA